MPFLRLLIFLSVSTSLSIPSPPLLSSNLVQLRIELSRHTSVRPLTHIHPFIHPPIHPSIYSSTHPPIHLSIQPSTQPFIYILIQTFIHPNTLSTHPYILHSLQDNKQNNKQQKLPTNWAYGRLSHARGPLPIKEL